MSSPLTATSQADPAGGPLSDKDWMLKLMADNPKGVPVLPPDFLAKLQGLSTGGMSNRNARDMMNQLNAGQ